MARAADQVPAKGLERYCWVLLGCWGSFTRQALFGSRVLHISMMLCALGMLNTMRQHTTPIDCVLVDRSISTL